MVSASYCLRNCSSRDAWAVRVPRCTSEMKRVRTRVRNFNLTVRSVSAAVMAGTRADSHHRGVTTALRPQGRKRGQPGRAPAGEAQRVAGLALTSDAGWCGGLRPNLLAAPAPRARCAHGLKGQPYAA